MSTDSGSWISQSQAAALAGVPVHMVVWAARAGRIVTREDAPTLSRVSVLAWVHRRAARRARSRDIAEGQHRSGPKRPSQPDGWLNVAAAADLLGLSHESVRHLAREGALQRCRSGKRVYVREDQVRALAAKRAEDRAEWMSMKAAAELAGCSEPLIEWAVRTERIEQRDVPRWLPSLRRSSVDAFAAALRAERAAAAVARQQREAERAARSMTPPAEVPGDPWLDQATTALVLGISRNRVGQLTRRGAIPHTKKGQRYWYRRSHVEQLAAARVARARYGAAK